MFVEKEEEKCRAREITSWPSFIYLNISETKSEQVFGAFTGIIVAVHLV